MSNEKYNGMQIVALSPAGMMHTIWLPGGTPEGRYSFEEYDIYSMYIEAKNGRWYAIAQKGAVFANCEGDRQFVTPVLNSDTLVLRQADGILYIIYSEDVTEENVILHNFIPVNADSISIGRDNGNDIKFDNPMVSGHQAVLMNRDNQWYVRDLGSLNGTYLNGRHVENEPLAVGDVIYIMGLKIVMGIGFFAMNIGGRPILMNKAKLKPMIAGSDIAGAEVIISDEESQDNLFNRNPRRRRSLKFEPIEIDGPPPSMNGNQMPMFLRFGRNAVMGTSSMMSGNFTSVITMLLFPLLTNRYTEKERKAYEDRRHEVYMKYLQNKKNQIDNEKHNEEETLRWNYPGLSEILSFPFDGRRLWERQKTDDDFLHVRVGIGNQPMMAQVSFSKNELTIDEEDDLDKAMNQITNNLPNIDRVPIQTSLIDDYVCGVSGDWEQRLEFIRNMILQIAILHSYDEVKLVILSDENTLETMSFVRYLPHVFSDQRDFRFLATNGTEAIKISEYLKNTFEINETAMESKLEGILKKQPYYVVIALDKKCFDSVEFLKEILQNGESRGVSIVAAFDNLPKECFKIFNLNAVGEHSVLYLRDLDHEVDTFRLDECENTMVVNSVRTVLNTSLKTIASAYTLPKMMTFLEMFGAGKIEHLNIENRWKTNNPFQSMATPIGVGTDGSLFMLDLHQKFQGPHGLVAGTTGSGKSEFLMTYILSMAVNYHPNEVAFVLIDYKGGGLAGAFDDPEHGVHLPHLVGTITNLDGGAIQRSLTSIQSEIMRRQRVFNDVKNATGEGTMDIYTYQHLYRNGKVGEPLPHLFIISDEFAELKQQEPEFMEKLISAARIGRSLGVHLILATQKPAGVVNDQIRSNTKFRVCLKVQDKQDSNDMLKRPDAADIKETGRFYLQVGYNEYFAMGQSAWSGADYTPRNEVIVQRDESIQVVDGVLQNIVEIKKKVETAQSVGSQLVSVVRYISDIAQKRDIKVRPLWKPAISDVVTYQDMEKWCKDVDYSSSVKASVGVIDDPENQEQFPLVVDFNEVINLLILGENGCGKTAMLQTMLYDITVRYSPERVNYYIVDCSSHSLRVFRDAPHCGAYTTEANEDEVNRLIKMITDIAKKRKKLFADEDVSSYEMYIRKHPLPMILFIIDNIGALNSFANGNDLYGDIAGYIRQCAGLGIQFVVTAAHLNDLYSKTKQEFNDRIALELKDKYAYSDFLNLKCNYTPAQRAGAGLAAVGERLLEYQTAVVMMDEGIINDEVIKTYVDDICKKYTLDYKVQKLPRIDETLEYADFCKGFSRGRIPLGYAVKEVKPVALPLKQFDALSVYIGNQNGTVPILNNLMHAFKENDFDFHLIKKAENSVLSGVLGGCVQVECNQDDIHEYRNTLISEYTKRVEVLQTYCRANGLKASKPDIYKVAHRYMLEHTKPLLVVIECMSDASEAMDKGTCDVIHKIKAVGRQTNIYFMACYYAEDKKLFASDLHENFNPEGLILMMGGCYDKEPFNVLPRQLASVDKPMIYNQGIARYNDKCYHILMPCGVVDEGEIDEDDRSIF